MVDLAVTNLLLSSAEDTKKRLMLTAVLLRLARLTKLITMSTQVLSRYTRSWDLRKGACIHTSRMLPLR
jgi:hypothetical protein